MLIGVTFRTFFPADEQCKLWKPFRIHLKERNGTETLSQVITGIILSVNESLGEIGIRAAVSQRAASYNQHVAVCISQRKNSSNTITFSPLMSLYPQHIGVNVVRSHTHPIMLNQPDLWCNAADVVHHQMSVTRHHQQFMTSAECWLQSDLCTLHELLFSHTRPSVH